MSFHIKYRPADLNQMKGISDIVDTLGGMLDKEKRASCPHSFLLSGPTGCGKTTLARIIARMLDCSEDDFMEIDTADFRGIDTIREIIRNSQFFAQKGESRVWVLDECHKLSNDAQNALLKVLEEPPSHVYFILCTTDPDKLISTVRGRCSQFQVKTLDDESLKSLLKRVVRREEQTLDENIYDQIILDSLGHPRNALQILEQVLNSPPEKRMIIARKTAEKQSQTIELCRALMKRTSWKGIAEILNGLKGQEAETIRRAVLGYCQAVLLKGQDEPLCGLIMEEFINPFYDSGFAQLTLACYTVVKNS